VREIIIKVKDADYIAFQKVANESGLDPTEKIAEIIQYYLIIERNRRKFTQTRIMPEL
jgi:hypothetical protein